MTTTISTDAVAAAAAWARVAAALPFAKGMYFNGCHKIYLAMDETENARFTAEKWERTSAPDLATLHDWFDSSCGQRFIYAVTTNVANPTAGYVRLIRQSEIADAPKVLDDDA